LGDVKSHTLKHSRKEGEQEEEEAVIKIRAM
jgi:hypothetical protein